jgi:dihydroorotase
MKVLLKSVRILHPDGKFETSESDILIVDGNISKIATGIKAESDTDVFEHKGAVVSIGWMDLKANFRDPGDETMEGLENGISAAAHGGFTAVILMPSTNPPVQSKADVEYLINKSKKHIVSIYPSGCLSVNREGKDITEMYDMKTAGAVAFTDDRRPVSDSGLLMRSLMYAKNINTVIISYPEDNHIAGKGQVHEGVQSTMAGLKGIPSFAEALVVSRDIKICEYTGGRLHFSTVSTANSVELIRQAKKNGLPVTAEVAAHQLFFDDTTVSSYDTHYKVKPPFREQHDIHALKEGIKDGTIDVICSDHQPQDEEAKVTEFEFASYGIAGIETAFSAALTASNGFCSLESIIKSFTVNPRRVLGMDIPVIKEGSPAELTIFDPELEWTPSKEILQTKSKNNPFIGTKLKGKALAIVNKGMFRRF